MAGEFGIESVNMIGKVIFKQAKAHLFAQLNGFKY